MREVFTMNGWCGRDFDRPEGRKHWHSAWRTEILALTLASQIVDRKRSAEYLHSSTGISISEAHPQGAEQQHTSRPYPHVRHLAQRLRTPCISWRIELIKKPT